MSARSLEGLLREIEGQLNWTGPNGKKMGHVVLKREKAEVLFAELSALLQLSSLSYPSTGIIDNEAKAKD